MIAAAAAAKREPKTCTEETAASVTITRVPLESGAGANEGVFFSREVTSNVLPSAGRELKTTAQHAACSKCYTGFMA